MNLIKFAWVLLYILGALIDYASRPSFFVGSMIAVLPTLFIGMWLPHANATTEKKTDPLAISGHLHNAAQPENTSQVPIAYPADATDPRSRERLFLVSFDVYPI